MLSLSVILLAKGAPPHPSDFISYLQTCHQLTESLVAYTVENAALTNSKDSMDEIVSAAKHIGPK